MANSDKIIPFKQATAREKSEFRLKTQISIYICRNGERYTTDCTSSNEDETIEDIILILKKILGRISNKIPKIKIKIIDYYELSFTLLYYEKSNNRHNWKYLCLPENIKLEKLAEYLYSFICIYEDQKSSH